ncbi:MAG: metallophosphoesterase family protein [Janthinobacterium lividum]
MRALILSDIHGNLEALQAVLSAGGACDQVWNLGDVVGYGASPNEVVGSMRTVATLGVRGNHDKVCAGLASAAQFNPVARDAAVWTQQQLTPESLAWLQAQPGGPLLCENDTVALAHGSPLHEDIYIQNIRDAWAPLQQMQARCTFFGHTHVQGGFGWESSRWFEVHPLQRRDEHRSSHWTMPLEGGRRYLLNPGSVGQPRDGDPRAAYAVLDDALETVTFHREPYDIDLAGGRILLAGLPERLAKRLHQGR